MKSTSTERPTPTARQAQSTQKASMPLPSIVPQILTAHQREMALGDEPFTPAYDMIFQLVAAIFSQSGQLQNELIGLVFEHGKPKQGCVVNIQEPRQIPAMLGRMLERWPMVVHAFEGWSAPDVSSLASGHPLRQSIVSLVLHTRDDVGAAICPSDATTRTVQKTELIFPKKTSGRCARQLPLRH